MAIPSGISAQLGIKTETTAGTGVVVDRFYEFNNESMMFNIERLESAGLRGGNPVLPSTMWTPGGQSVSGDVSLELHQKSFGLWFQHMFGTVATTTPGGGTLSRDHTFTPGDLPVSFTMQIGKPDSLGVVHPFTFTGCRVATWELANTVGEIGMLNLSIVGMSSTTATGLATATYPTADALLVFRQATLNVAGAPIDVRGMTISGDNGLNPDRPVLGSAVPKVATEATMKNYTGTIDAYFSGLTAYTRFVNGTEAALVALWTGSIIEAAIAFKIQLTCNVRFDGDTPTVSGPEEVGQPLPFKAVRTGAGTGTAITAVVTNTDTAP